MKKIFTSISLAAMTFIAAAPVAGQQQRTLTDQEKAALVQTIVPAVFDQVKQISGVDLMGLANPNIENIVTSPLFFPQTAGLRADALPTLSFAPDSMKLDLSGMDFTGMLPENMKPVAPMIQQLLNDVKLTFKNYKEYTLPTGSYIAQVKLPEMIDVSAASMTDNEGKPATLLSIILATGEKGTILPFNSLSVELKLGALAQLGAMMGDKFPLKDGKLITLTETKENTGVINYNVTLEENLRSLSAAIAQVPNFQIAVDMTKMMTAGTIQAGLYGIPVQAPTMKLPMGDATVYANLKPTAFLPADSILLTSYKTGSADIQGYKKLVPATEVKGANIVLTTSSAVRANAADAWINQASQIVTLPATMGPGIQNIQGSLVGQIVGGMTLKADMNQDFTITVDSTYAGQEDKVINVMKMIGSITVPSGQAGQVANFDIQTRKDGALATTMNIKATVSAQAPNIVVEFSPAAMQMETPMATAYLTSNLANVTANETISPAEALSIRVADGGIYVRNCDKGTYSIVGMNGKAVAHGIISGPGAFIATPTLQSGNIYIITIVEDGVAQSIKFKK